MISRDIQQIEKHEILVESTRARKEEWNSFVEFERPRKRVRISCAEPSVHRYDIRGENPSEVTSEEDQTTRRANRTWLTRQELGYFRSCAKKLCRSNNLDDVLRNAYFLADKLDAKDSQSIADTLAEHEAYVAQRGLERWSSSQHALVRSVKIVEVKTAVLLEQTSQFLSGRRNPNRLAKVSMEASNSSQYFAQFLASTDASLARQVRDEITVAFPSPQPK